MNPDGKVAFITGAASGIGKHLARSLYQRNFRIMATDLNLEALQSVAAESGWSDSQVILKKQDVRDAQRWSELVSEIVARWGTLDFLFNIAGYLMPGFIHETSSEMVDRHIDINAKGLIFGTKAAAEQMVKQGFGHIINMGSMAAIAPVPGLNLYTASKMAVRGFSLAVAQELRSKGVYVTVVCPDVVQTPMLDLEKKHKEAALAFSGSRAFTVEEVEAVIFGKVLVKRPLEVVFPRGRGWTAKLVNCFPRIALWVGPLLIRKGLAKQSKLKENVV